MSGFEELKKEEARMTALLQERAASIDPAIACKARFALAVGIPFQVCLNGERLRAAPRGGDGQGDVFAAAVNVIANMLAITSQHYMLAIGKSQRHAAAMIGGAVSEETERIFAIWRETGEYPVPVAFDRDGNEVPFDALAMMSGK